jgi:hypothetical protein
MALFSRQIETTAGEKTEAAEAQAQPFSRPSALD